VDLKFKMAYFKSIYDRYQKASKRLKAKILDQFCEVCKYNRKYAISKLNGPSPEDRVYSKKTAKKRRRHGRIYDEEVIYILHKVWKAAGYLCSKRLKALIPLWMPWIEKHFRLTAETKQKLLEISPRQMDRRLSSHRSKVKNRIYGRTKPGALLKHHIPIKTDHWNVNTPGYTEVDTVSHSGNSADGIFVYSVNQTDILTGWVETRAVLGKGEKVVNEALEDMEGIFPFKILGIDSDNGGEFINYHLWERCKRQKIEFTRGRSYKKDDNAHIEQKNWTHVRKLMGWARYDTQKAANAMNNLYRNELHLFMNLFMPSMKLIKKERIGSRSRPRHDKPQTPLDRVIASEKGDPIKVEKYKRLRENTDPFELSRIIDKKIRNIYTMTNRCHSPKHIIKKKTKRTQHKLNQMEQEVMKEVSDIFGIEIRRPNGKSYS
jgi:hypothetical protein